MNIKRAISTAVLLWVLIFFEVSILMFGLGLEGTTYYMVHYLLLILLIAISAHLYFKGKKIKANLTEGLKLGITYVIVGVILDAVITVPLFIKDYFSFFLDLKLVVGLLITIIVATISGIVKR